MTAKRQRTKEERNYWKDIGNETNQDQANDEYLLQFWETMEWKLQVIKVVYLFILFIIHLFIKLRELFSNGNISIIIIEEYWVM